MNQSLALRDIQNYNFDSVLHIEGGNNLIDLLSVKLGFSLKIICPPVKICVLCEKLTLNNRPTLVAVHKVTGPEIYSKYMSRGCKLVKKSKVDHKAKERYLLS